MKVLIEVSNLCYETALGGTWTRPEHHLYKAIKEGTPIIDEADLSEALKSEIEAAVEADTTDQGPEDKKPNSCDLVSNCLYIMGLIGILWYGFGGGEPEALVFSGLAFTASGLYVIAANLRRLI